MLRRLHPEQPDSFAFTPANQAWAEKQMIKYPEGRQASAIIPLLWRAQEQEGWLSKPAIEAVADMLGLAYIRALEVATFYFMYQLQPVGSVAHVQVCGTTSCMICGAEDLVAVCREKIARNPHDLSADGKFSWEEVECLGACSNAPMVQIGKDFYEDLTVETFTKVLDAFARGEIPKPGPQNGRFAAEPASGLTSLKIPAKDRNPENRSVELALAQGDTIARITGEATTPAKRAAKAKTPAKSAPIKPAPAASTKGKTAPVDTAKPAGLKAARKGGRDNLKLIKGVGPKLEMLLNSLGYYHFYQIAGWSPAEIAWVDDNLKGFKGRATRDGWVAQAEILAKGGDTEFSIKSRKGGS